MSDRPLGSVHLIADLDAFAPADDLLAAVSPLLEAGLPSVQLRGGGRSATDLVRAGTALRAAAAKHRCSFVVNGSVDAARALDADGLHLPARALVGDAGESPASLRAKLPGRTTVGVSCHDAAELRRARGADWVFLSPVFPTASKPGATGLGIAGVRRLLALAPAPVYALGGVTSDNVLEVLGTGCAGVAAIRGLRGEPGLRLLAAARVGSHRR